MCQGRSVLPKHTGAAGFLPNPAAARRPFRCWKGYRIAPFPCWEGGLGLRTVPSELIRPGVGFFFLAFVMSASYNCSIDQASVVCMGSRVSPSAIASLRWRVGWSERGPCAGTLCIPDPAAPGGPRNVYHSKEIDYAYLHADGRHCRTRAAPRRPGRGASAIQYTHRLSMRRCPFRSRTLQRADRRYHRVQLWWTRDHPHLVYQSLE